MLSYLEQDFIDKAPQGEGVNNTTELSEVSLITVPNYQKRLVIDANIEYVYYSAATSGDVQPIVGVGYWNKWFGDAINITGNTNEIVFNITGDTYGTDSNLYWDNLNKRLGVGVIPLATVHISGGTGSLSTGLAFGDGDTGIYESVDDRLFIVTAGNNRFFFQDNALKSYNSGGAMIHNVVSTSTTPSLFPSSIDTNTGIGHAGADQLSLIAGGKEGIRVSTGNTLINSGLHISGGTGLSTGLMFGDGDTGFYENIDDTLQVLIAGGSVGSFSSTYGGSFKGPTIDSILMVMKTAATSTTPVFTFRDSINTGIGKVTGEDQLSLIAGGIEGIRVSTGNTLINSGVHISGGTGSLSTGLAFGDGDTGFYESVDDTFKMEIGGAAQWFMQNGTFKGVSNGRFEIKTLEAASATNPLFTIRGDDDTGIGSAGDNQLSLIAGGIEGIRVSTGNTIIYNELNVSGNTDITGVYMVNGVQIGIGDISGLTESQDAQDASIAYVSGVTDTKADANATIVLLSGSSTLNESFNNKIVEVSGTTGISGITITIPTGLTYGWQIVIVNSGTVEVIIESEGTIQSIDNATSMTNQYGASSIYHKGNNIYVLFGDLS